MTRGDKGTNNRFIHSFTHSILSTTNGIAGRNRRKWAGEPEAAKPLAPHRCHLHIAPQHRFTFRGIFPRSHCCLRIHFFFIIFRLRVESHRSHSRQFHIFAFFDSFAPYSHLSLESLYKFILTTDNEHSAFHLVSATANENNANAARSTSTQVAAAIVRMERLRGKKQATQ